jgi:hypothetical protein
MYHIFMSKAAFFSRYSLGLLSRAHIFREQGKKREDQDLLLTGACGTL